MKKLLILTTFAISIVGQANASIIINGSFEMVANEAQAPKLYGGVAKDSTFITGWTVTRTTLELIGTYWQASDGGRSLDLNGISAAGIAQIFSTVPGVSYQVQFDQAANPDGGSRISNLGFQAAGQSADFPFTCVGYNRSSMGWETRTWSFTAIDFTTTLEFYSLDTATPAYGPALDNVIVTAIPEPATLSILALGSLSLLRRKRAS